MGLSSVALEMVPEGLRPTSTLSFAVTTVGLLLVYNICHNAFNYYRNWTFARRSGLPYLCAPFYADAPWHMLLGPILIPFLMRTLPEKWTENLTPSGFGWELKDKYRFHAKHGEAFLVVSSVRNNLWCADPDLCHTILSRRDDFPVLKATEYLMNTHGPCVIAVNGDTWVRQRKVIVPNLNEKISQSTWINSWEQAAAMVQCMLEQPDQQCNRAINGLRAVAINVLGSTIYGIHRDFALYKVPQHPNEIKNYIDVASVISQLLIPAVIIPQWLLSLPFMPMMFRTLGAAEYHLPIMTNKMLEHERSRMHAEPDARESLVRSLVRLLDQGKAAGEAAGEHDNKKGLFLSEDEIRGNLFLVTLAGFDTSANTASYAMVHLAGHPDIQAWVQEEVDRVFPDRDSLLNPDYFHTYPKLPRVLSVLYETLRHVPPLVHISRGCAPGVHEVMYKGKKCIIEGEVGIANNVVCLHTNPKYWGDDSLEFNPRRWIDSSSGTERCRTMPKNIYMPWSEGPRACPGLKMAQVEAVAVFARLLRELSFEPIPRKGESMDQALKRTRQMVLDSTPRITIQLNNPLDLNLQFKSRF